jgi:AmmeMemoRadiSam system protein A
MPDLSVVELVYGKEEPAHLAKIVEKLLDDSHTAVVISTDLSHYYDIKKAERLDSICLDAIAKLDPARLHQGCEACGKIGVEAMLIAAKSRALLPKILDYRTSADTSGDRSQVVGYASVAFIQKGKEEKRMDKMDKKEVLLKLARAAIAEEFGIDYGVDKEALRRQNPWLEEEGAAFVTLNRKGDGSLRGCIGSIIAHQSLYEDVIKNAKSAAFNDPRFVALTPEEFEQITVEVSVLTPPEKLPYRDADDLKSKLRPGIDGVILKHGNYQATFLPQVWEQLPSFEMFISHLCQKAGMGSECLSLHPEVYVYQVEEYKEA